jgi:uncharacterized OB-fold protein
MAETPPQQPARKIPPPHANVETEPFWAAAREGRFMIGRCTTCGEPHYYPRSLCPFCFGPAVLEEASGEGEIYTLSVTHRGAPEPFAIGYVTLKEGPRILTNFVDCPLSDLTIGQAVRLVFTPTEGGAPVPTFTPV